MGEIVTVIQSTTLKYPNGSVFHLLKIFTQETLSESGLC